MSFNTKIFVICDGVHNTVFASQVVDPLKRWLHTKKNRTAYIVTFEKKIQNIPKEINGIKLIALKRTTYMGRWSLWPCVWRLRSLLSSFNSYELIARGPFAGYICKQSITSNCQKLTIQARGLAAQEHAFTHRNSLSILHKQRIQQLHRLEQSVYSKLKQSHSIQAVSPALKEYLEQNYNVQNTQINIATHDIPNLLAAACRAELRKQTRKKIGIPPNAPVYCYSGSYKPWQCPQETLRYFAQQLNITPKAHLLILTHDQKPFQKLATMLALAPETYTIMQAKSTDLMNYLSAADFGLLFRQQHIINQTARPTKALEYHAASLTIIHNDTVDFIRHLPAAQQIVSL